MKQHKGKIIAAVIILCVLSAAYFWGGNYAGGDRSSRTDTPSGTLGSDRQQTALKSCDDNHVANPPQPDTAAEPAETENSEFSPGVCEGSADYSRQQGMVLDEKTGKDKYLTDPVPMGKPLPVEPQDVISGDTAYTAILSVCCDTILDNIKYLDKEKVELVPEDGIIFPPTEVIFYEGESVFNLLQREMKKNKIHMEFRNTPIYNSAYIRGIHNLYEFDVGELSGWMYKVNGWFPNYGASRYQLKDGDVVEWVYTCDLGRDVGGYYATGGG